MKNLTLLFTFLALPLIIFGKNNKDRTFLKKVLDRIEKIESAEYYSTHESYNPYDKNPEYIETYFTKEYKNVSDSTIGSSYAQYSIKDTSKLHFCYDGKMKAYVDEEKKGVVIDSFKVNRKAPVRTVWPPFFNYVTSIIKYTLETSDSINIELNDMGDSLLFKLNINESKQVEFVGKPIYVDNPYAFGDTSSKYYIWIKKSDYTPYKIKREMSHEISVESIKNHKINSISIQNFIVSNYLPKGYEIRYVSEIEKRKRKESNYNNTNVLVGQKAPDWSLFNADSLNIHLKDIKSKVILIQFTGIGCGPCFSSIPMLKNLVDDYDSTKLELISIETWSGSLAKIRKYQTNHNLNYQMVQSTKTTEECYNITMVPMFFIVDKNRVIRKVINGYSKESTDSEIKNAINELL